MAEDEDRAARIRELKGRNPRLTWAKIAEFVGVTERSAIKWQRTGALDTENAEKLAELFDVEFDYLWFGPRPDTPDLFGKATPTVASEHQVEGVAHEFRGHVGGLEQRVTQLAEQLAGDRQDREANIAEVKRLIAEQSAALKEQAQVLLALGNAVNDLRETIAMQQSAARHLEETVRRFDERTEEAVAALPKSSPRETARQSAHSGTSPSS